MTGEQFDAVLNARIEKIRATLAAKAGEYMVGEDRLSNFRRAAEIRHVDMAEACFWFMTKHFVSVQDMVEAGRLYPAAQWDEKIGDMINYLVLLEAIAIETRTK